MGSFSVIALSLGIAELGLQLSDDQQHKSIQFLEMLAKKNEVVNLTRVPTDDWISLHLLDSLAVAPLIAAVRPKTVLDVGTGGGFPGIPLAIALPSIQFTLIDGTRKKIDFVKEVITSLGLTNVKAEHARAEELLTDVFDVVVSRAVAPLVRLVPLIVPLLSISGIGLAMKGPGVEEEITALDVKSRKFVKKVVDIKIPGAGVSRTVVEIGG